MMLDGHSVRFTVKMRGRELAHKEIGDRVMSSIVEFMQAFSKIQDKVQKLDNRIIATFVKQ